MDIMGMIRGLEKAGLLVGSYGNASERVGNRILITPSGVPYSRMRKKDLAVVGIDGKPLKGKPSSEWRMHVEIYRSREDVGAIAHLHSPYASVLACLRKGAKCRTEDAVQLIGDRIPVAKYALSGTWELARNVAEKMKKANAVIMANHGIVVAGRTAYEAYLAAIAAEKACMIEVLGGIIGRLKPIPKRQREILKRKFLEYRKNFQ